jgi:acyl-CoA synthetase (AMP-forming)/AMP-acid ligase II
LSKTVYNLQHGPAGKNARSRVFSCLGDLLACQARAVPEGNAVLGPGRPPITYGALWAAANNTLHRLRSVGVGRSDRVAVVLPDGPESAVATIAAASGAVCVPLNPGFTAHGWQRYFGALRVAALVIPPPRMGRPARSPAAGSPELRACRPSGHRSRLAACPAQITQIAS